MPFEKKLAKAAQHARIEKDPHTDPAPVPANETTFLAGADVYRQNCAVCHGLPGESQTAIAEGMYPKPPELFHGTGVTDDPAWETYWKAKNGLRLSGMPSFKTHLNDTQLWQVSVLLANADKISPAVKTVLASPPSIAPPPASATAPVKK
jgi:mono/diheme cytochrome c family protein